MKAASRAPMLATRCCDDALLTADAPEGERCESRECKSNDQQRDVPIHYAAAALRRVARACMIALCPMADFRPAPVNKASTIALNS